MRARARAALGDTAAAREDYDRALRTGPNPDWYIERARLVRAIGGPRRRRSTGSTRASRGSGPIVTLTLEAIDCELSLGASRCRPRPPGSSRSPPPARIRSGHCDAATSCWPPAVRRTRVQPSPALSQRIDALPPARQHTRQNRGATRPCGIGAGRYSRSRRGPHDSTGPDRILRRHPAPLLRLVAAVLALSTLPASPARGTHPCSCPPGAVWRYLDNGSDQGTAWRAAAFNDTGWKSGAAELGYGDGDEATVVGYGPNSTRQVRHDVFPPRVQRGRSRPPTAGSRCACCATTARSCI